MQNHRLSLTQPTDTPVPDSHTIPQELGYEYESVASASREPVSREAKEIAPEREAPELKACPEVEERVVVEESVAVAESAEPLRFAAVDINEHILAVVDLSWSGDFNQFGNLHPARLGEALRRFC